MKPEDYNRKTSRSVTNCRIGKWLSKGKLQKSKKCNFSINRISNIVIGKFRIFIRSSKKLKIIYKRKTEKFKSCNNKQDKIREIAKYNVN